MTHEELVNKLIHAAYDSGYYSGRNQDGEPHHIHAIEEREMLRREVLRLLTQAPADDCPAPDNCPGCEKQIELGKDCPLAIAAEPNRWADALPAKESE